MATSQAHELIAELKPYITSGNDVPVTRVTLPAELIERILRVLDTEWSEGYDEGRNDGYDAASEDHRYESERNA